MAAVMMTGPGGEYVDDDGYFTCAVSVQHKVGTRNYFSMHKILKEIIKFNSTVAFLKIHI